jgi:hypothetical protein
MVTQLGTVGTLTTELFRAPHFSSSRISTS